MKILNFFSKRLKLISISYLLLFSLQSCNQDKREPIHVDSNLVGMVGYGSLISLSSMEETLEVPYRDSIYLIHLNGYIREWTDLTLINEFPNSKEDSILYLNGQDSLSFDGMISLNIRAEAGSKINCVLYLIKKEDLQKFDEREFGYERIDVSKSIEEMYFDGTPVYTYKTLPEHEYKPGQTSKTYIIEEDYLNLVYHACDSIGTKFRNEFNLSTTTFDTQIKVKPIVQKKKRVRPTQLN